MKKQIDLCSNCVWAKKISGYGNELKFCMATRGGLQVNFPVEVCSTYEEKGNLSKWDMEIMAIYIEKKKDSAGFRFTKHTDGRIEEIP